MSETNTQGVAVYRVIAAVMKEIAKTGIAKGRNNQSQGYKFRGIDDVYNALAPILADKGLVILPTVFSREVVERTNAKGTALFYTTVGVDFALVAAEDGSSHTVRTYGEAMDSGDKATNKAMSAAYKYACMQAFCIPTEGDNDADGQTHEVAAAEPEGFSAWWASLPAIAAKGIAALQTEWVESAPEFKKFTHATLRAEWDALKAIAAEAASKSAEAVR